MVVSMVALFGSSTPLLHERPTVVARGDAARTTSVRPSVAGRVACGLWLTQAATAEPRGAQHASR
jgi:hypothetical protein